MQNEQIHSTTSCWDFHIHRSVHTGNKLIEIRKEEMLPNEFLRRFRDLQNSKACTGNEVPKVIHKSFHLNLSGGCEVLKPICIFGEIVAFQSVDYRFEGLYDAVQVNWINNLASSISTFRNDTVCSEFIDDVIVKVELHAVFIRDDLHKYSFEASDLYEYLSRDVQCWYSRSSRSCVCAFAKCVIVITSAFGIVQFLSEYLCKPIDEKRLSPCLCVNGFNDFWSKRLSCFICVLPK